MEEFLQQLTNGLAVGGIYALIALGYTMVYGVLKLINFAHGDLFTIGAFLGLTLLTSLGLTDAIGPVAGLLVLAVMVVILVGVVGFLLERIAYRPLRTSPRLSAVVSALGASIFSRTRSCLSGVHGHLCIHTGYCLILQSIFSVLSFRSSVF